jgi:hypothetical protein
LFCAGKAFEPPNYQANFWKKGKELHIKKIWGFFKLKLFFCRGLTGRGRQMCDSFLNKQKFRVVARTAHITKKMANFDACLLLLGQAARSTLRVRIFLPEFFFLLLKETKRITVTF